MGLYNSKGGGQAFFYSHSSMQDRPDERQKNSVWESGGMLLHTLMLGEQ